MASNLAALDGPVQLPASGGKAEQLVVFLHGVGADGNDLIALAPMLSQILPDAQFISPDAPEPCDMAPYGFQWFSLRNWSHEAMLRGVEGIAPVLNDFLDGQLAELGLSDENLAVVGFSQGTMTALYSALRRKNPVACIVGFSGAMIGAENLEHEIKSRPPVCLIHGDSDPVVPFEAMAVAEAALNEAKVPVETHIREGLAHGIDPEGIQFAAHFLKKHLKA